MTEVRVIIPTCNRSWALRRAVESAKRQTFRGFELLIVDDASTDDTECVVQSFSDRRIRHARQRINRGIGRHWDDDYYLIDRFLADRENALDAHPSALWHSAGSPP